MSGASESISYPMNGDELNTVADLDIAMLDMQDLPSLFEDSIIDDYIPPEMVTPKKNKSLRFADPEVQQTPEKKFTPQSSESLQKLLEESVVTASSPKKRKLELVDQYEEVIKTPEPNFLTPTKKVKSTPVTSHADIDKFDELPNNVQKQIMSLFNYIDKQKNKIDNYKHRLNSRDKVNKDMTNKNNDLKKQLDDKETECLSHVEALQTLQQNIEDLTNDINNLKNKEDTTLADGYVLKSEFETLQNVNEELSAENIKLTTYKDELNEMYNKVIKEIEDMKAESKDKDRREIGTATSPIVNEDEQETKEFYKRTVAELKIENDKIVAEKNKKICALKINLSEWKKSYKTLNQQYDDIDKDVTETDKKLEEAIKSHAEIKTNYKRLKEEHKQLKEEHNQCKQSITMKRSTIDAVLEEEYKKMKSEVYRKFNIEESPGSSSSSNSNNMKIKDLTTKLHNSNNNVKELNQKLNAALQTVDYYENKFKNDKRAGSM
ncbi:Maph28 [Matsumuraeses phaseoli granulovirus]|uniref:Maph28 n=1 Tax=Matsumuraeses phaseoli granulovirus TaxID=2760664 RepID=A0AAE7MLB4_9BBAC|nr:Maph28 [Matsumuraeses phaseoli granulovirus]QOD39991.1 Maph28 [Matsumuraeses phaseoli granulovirus]